MNDKMITGLLIGALVGYYFANKKQGADHAIGKTYLRSQWPSAGGGNSHSQRKMVNEKYLEDPGIRGHFERLFEILFWKKNGAKTAYQEGLLKLSDYFNLRVEVWARTFEIYIMSKFQKAGITNTWTVKKKRNAAMPHFHLVEEAAPEIEAILDAAFKRKNSGVSGYENYFRTC